MLSPKYSRFMAIKKQLAVANKDWKMVKKLENLKEDSDVTEEMLNYKLKEKLNKKTRVTL